MTLLDKILAILAMVGLLAFIGVIGGFVLEPDLIIIFLIGGVLAGADFWMSFRKRDENKTEGRPPF